MATTYELSYFQTDTGLSGTSFVYGFDALTSADVRVIGYSGAGGATKTDLTSTIATVNTTTKTLTFTTAPTAYSKIRIYRSTTVLPLIEFTSGAVLSEDALNTAYRHSLFAAQEVSQDASDSSNRSVIFTADINNGAITTEKIAIDAVNATKIADNSILDEHITVNAVTNTKIANGAVTGGKIGTAAILETNIASNAVTTSKILDSNVTVAKLPASLDLSEKTLILPSKNQQFSNQFFYAVESYASGIAAPTSILGTQVRVLNTIVENTLGATLASNRVTLTAGKYLLEYAAPAYRTSAHACFPYQATPTAAVLGHGSNAFSAEGSSANNYSQSHSQGTTIINLIAASTTIELRHYTAAVMTNGLGVPVSLAGRNEIYSWIKIWKLD